MVNLIEWLCETSLNNEYKLKLVTEKSEEASNSQKRKGLGKEKKVRSAKTSMMDKYMAYRAEH